MADAFKKARPDPEACRCCMAKRLKPKASRIARARLKRELPDAGHALMDLALDRLCDDGSCEWCNPPRAKEETR